MGPPEAAGEWAWSKAPPLFGGAARGQPGLGQLELVQEGRGARRAGGCWANGRRGLGWVGTGGTARKNKQASGRSGGRRRVRTQALEGQCPASGALQERAGQDGGRDRPAPPWRLCPGSATGLQARSDRRGLHAGPGGPGRASLVPACGAGAKPRRDARVCTSRVACPADARHPEDLARTSVSTGKAAVTVRPQVPVARALEAPQVRPGVKRLGQTAGVY